MTGVNLPSVIFRGKLAHVEKLKSSEKYRLTLWGGSREFMNELHENGQSRKDKTTGKTYIHISFKPNYQSKKDTRPEMNLELKGLNISGVKNWLEFGKLTGFGYGEPSPDPTYSYSGKRKANYLYKYRDCAILFRFSVNEQDPTDTTPTEIEIIVVEGKGARNQARNYLTMLRHGGFDEVLAKMQLQEYDSATYSDIKGGECIKK